MNDLDFAKARVAAWLDEAEGYSVRRERLVDDVRASPNNVLIWLEAAFALGMQTVAKDPSPANKSIEDWVQERRAWAEEARNFPDNTCPASRHTHMIADGLADQGTYPAIEDEPAHVAGSLYGTVAALWEARNRIAELEDKATDDPIPVTPSA